LGDTGYNECTFTANESVQQIKTSINGLLKIQNEMHNVLRKLVHLYTTKLW